MVGAGAAIGLPVAPLWRHTSKASFSRVSNHKLKEHGGGHNRRLANVGISRQPWKHR